jgi:hypothetical protein
MRISLVILSLLLLLCGATVTHAGLLSIGVGVYGGMSMPVEMDAKMGSIVGARVKVLPAIPLVGVEGYYASVNQKSPRNLWDEQDLDVVFEGDTYTTFGANLLIGGLSGPGLRTFGIAGINFVEFDDHGTKELKYGGELGFGVEIVPPFIDLGIEGRASAMILGWEEGPDRKLTTVTVGVNYYF